MIMFLLEITAAGTKASGDLSPRGSPRSAMCQQ